MTSLVSAVEAVKDKIENSASGATPEELAYLGTAIDRIGGRATVYEVVAAGDIKKQEIVTLGDSLKTDLATIGNGVTDGVQDDLNTLLAEYQNNAFVIKDSSISAITDTKNAATSEIQIIKDSATTDINDTKSVAESHINNVKVTAIEELNTAEAKIVESRDKALVDVSKAIANVSETVDETTTAIQNTFLQRSLFIASF